MRKTKVIKIDEREITVWELRVKDIRALVERAGQFENDLDLIEPLIPELLDVELPQLEELAPSELKIIWEAVKEVNADFLELIERTGVANAVKDSLRTLLTASFSGLSSGDIPEHGNTDSGSS